MMEGDSLKLNFEIALEKIDTLSKHNQSLLDKIQDLEFKLSESNTKIEPIKSNEKIQSDRFNAVTAGADEAMKRYKQYLKKEFSNAKSKQSKRQPV
tara:strand:- start:311 stop:598 length:288 start_codon:yes stop_codon:yes gene_type:complete